MAEKPDTDSPKIKVKRQRSRLYEAASREPTSDTGSPSVDERLPLVPAGQPEKRLAAAHGIIHRYVAYSAGTALLPIPVLDMIAVTAIELRMLKRLSDHYGLVFSEQRGKSLVGSLIGGFHAGLFAQSLLKAVPVVGLTAALVPMAVLAGALTYAVGKVFVYHFETGGTLLDFDPPKSRAFFESQLAEGRKVASRLRKGTRRK